jgi:hypothetical protein
MVDACAIYALMEKYMLIIIKGKPTFTQFNGVFAYTKQIYSMRSLLLKEAESARMVLIIIIISPLQSTSGYNNNNIHGSHRIIIFLYEQKLNRRA